MPYTGLMNLIVLAMLLNPATVLADSPDARARDAFARGTEAYQNVEFSEALAYFEEAYRLRPAYRIQYNIAQTYLELNRPHLALGAFERYLSEGRMEIDRERREDVVREIRKLRKMVGEIVVVGQTGAECRIDNQHMGFLPQDKPIRLDSGIHEVTIHMHGEVICQKNVNIVAGKKRIEQCRADYENQETSEPESAWDVMSDTTLKEYDLSLDAPRPVVRKPSAFFKVAPWISLGLAVAAGTTGTLLALKTNNLNAELSGACDDGVCGPDRESDVNRLPRLALGADIMLVTAAVLTGVGIVLFAVKRKKKNAEQTAPTREPRRLEDDMSLIRPRTMRGEF